jgi:hypothetical protein
VDGVQRGLAQREGDFDEAVIIVLCHIL